MFTGFLLIFLTAGNLIAIGGYKMPGGPGALEAIRFSQSDKVKSTQPVMHK